MRVWSCLVAAAAFGALALGGALDSSFAAAVPSDPGNDSATRSATPLLLADNDRDDHRSSRRRRKDDDDDRHASHPRWKGVHEMMSPEALEGTIWVGKKQHRRVTITIHGDIQIKEGKDIYVRFLRKVDNIFVIEVRWWNEGAKLNVLEHGVLTQIEPNLYRYIEADQLSNGLPNADFPGIVGRGTFELLSKDTAELIQIGHLNDGSASGFTTILELTDTLPYVPVDQTYPPVKPPNP